MHAVLRRCSVLLLLLPGLAFAHPLPDHALSFAAGMSHPFSGLDHMLAMIAVGALGARLNARAVWMLPLTFMIFLSIGAVIGMAGPTTSWVEPAIAASIIALGTMLASKRWFRPFATASIMGLFALAHGYAHGAEAASGQGEFVIGMLMASAALHVAGILAVVAIRRLPSQKADGVLRIGGAVLALIGATFLFT